MRMLLAERHDLPSQIVDQLADDRDAKVLKSLATNPALSADQLRTMVSTHGPRVAARVAANPSCPPDPLLQLAWTTPVEVAGLTGTAKHDTVLGETI
jgi:hypothetical protein